MNALQAITKRVSAPQLTGPDITPEQLEILLQAALRAADHAWLRPSRYFIIQGKNREKLGDLFVKSTPDFDELSDEKRRKIKHMPMRAPLILASISQLTEHPKVPHDEQLWSTAAGVQNILNAAHALGLGAIWRTGDMAHNPDVLKGLGVQANERLVGFVYIGHVSGNLKQVPVVNSADYVTEWP